MQLAYLFTLLVVFVLIYLGFRAIQNKNRVRKFHQSIKKISDKPSFDFLLIDDDLYFGQDTVLKKYNFLDQEVTQIHDLHSSEIYWIKHMGNEILTLSRGGSKLLSFNLNTEKAKCFFDAKDSIIEDYICIYGKFMVIVVTNNNEVFIVRESATVGQFQLNNEFVNFDIFDNRYVVIITAENEIFILDIDRFDLKLFGSYKGVVKLPERKDTSKSTKPVIYTEEYGFAILDLITKELISLDIKIVNHKITFFIEFSDHNLFVAYDDGEIEIFNRIDGRSKKLKVSNLPPISIHCSKSQDYVFVRFLSWLFKFDKQGNYIKHNLQGYNLKHLIFSIDGSRLVLSDGQGNVGFLSTSTLRIPDIS